MGQIRVGTAGWTDRTLIASGWYPAEASTPERRLRYYASQFPLVEVDATYYALPAEQTARAWADWASRPANTYALYVVYLMTLVCVMVGFRTRLMTLAVVFAGVIALLADIAFRSMVFGGGRSRGRGGLIVLIAALVGFLLAPIAAGLLRMALSRRREYLADATAAEILNDPEAVALALRRLELDTTTVRHADSA